MADSHSPYMGVPYPQHQDNGIPVPSYPQAYDFSPGYNNPQYGTLQHAFVPQYQQPSVSSGQRPTHPQYPQYPHPYPVGGVPVAPYMGYPGGMYGGMFQHSSTGTRAVSIYVLARLPQNHLLRTVCLEGLCAHLQSGSSHCLWNVSVLGKKTLGCAVLFEDLFSKLTTNLPYFENAFARMHLVPCYVCQS